MVLTARRASPRKSCSLCRVSLLVMGQVLRHVEQHPHCDSLAVVVACSYAWLCLSVSLAGRVYFNALLAFHGTAPCASCARDVLPSIGQILCRGMILALSRPAVSHWSPPLGSLWPQACVEKPSVSGNGAAGAAQPVERVRVSQVETLIQIHKVRMMVHVQKALPTVFVWGLVRAVPPAEPPEGPDSQAPSGVGSRE